MSKRDDKVIKCGRCGKRNIRVHKLKVTQEQLARILRLPGISNGEAVNAIEHGRGDIPEQFERELRQFAKARATR